MMIFFLSFSFFLSFFHFFLSLGVRYADVDNIMMRAVVIFFFSFFSPLIA